jgi:TolB-like protein/Flp pilus assembly protein TadD
MKRCPQCGREYDNTMMFCLDDGSELLYGPASASGGDEPATAILHSTAAPGEAQTRAQIHMTDQTAILPASMGDIAAKPRGFDKRLFFAPLVLAIVVLGGFFGFRYITPAKQIESIAVMPFVNESGNADVEYLSDGMTETLIKSLSGLPNMDVRPRSAVFRYKGKDTDLPTIGKELNVQAILNGRVIQRGDLLTLSLELVDVQKNRVIWTEQYQRRQAEVVSLQSEIAKDVSAKLSPRLSGADETKVSKQATADPVAYQAYLRGRYFWNKRTADGMYKATEQFQIAIDRDPNYALAFTGLADSYSLLPNYTPTAPADSLSRAERFARQAIAIDGQLAEPHATLGNIYYSKWQWADAETEFKRAIELNPNYPTLYHWYSLLLFALGRYDEGDAVITRAHELDPMSSIISQNLAQTYRRKDDHKTAIEICQKIMDLDPNFPGGHFAIAWSYLKTGRNEEAIAEFRKAAELGGWSSSNFGELGVAFAVSGRTKEAQAMIKELEEQFRNKQAEGKDLAIVYASLGDKDKAFEWLEKDFSSRTVSLPEIRWSPGWEPLRDDPRYKDLLKRMGLPE